MIYLVNTLRKICAELKFPVYFHGSWKMNDWKLIFIGSYELDPR